MDSSKKAKELIDKFKRSANGYVGTSLEYKNSKKCALICVEEMIQSHIDWSTEQLEVFTELEKVKAEILKL